MPLLFALDKERKYNVLFKYDEVAMKWYVDFEVNEEAVTGKKKTSRSKKR